MAYDTETLKQQALDAIDKNELIWIEEVVSYLPCSKQTFYAHELDKVDEIKKRLDSNKINKKVQMRDKWFNQDNATLQMGLYKLLASDIELKKLSMQHIDHTSDGDKIQGSPIIIGNPAGPEPDEL